MALVPGIADRLPVLKRHPKMKIYPSYGCPLDIEGQKHLPKSKICLRLRHPNDAGGFVGAGFSNEAIRFVILIPYLRRFTTRPAARCGRGPAGLAAATANA